MIMMIRRDMICYTDRQTDLVMAINHTYIHLPSHAASVRHSSQIVPDGFIGEVVHYHEILHHHFTSVIHGTAASG